MSGSTKKQLVPNAAKRLTKRANKRGSDKRIIPTEYLRSKENAAVLGAFLSIADKFSLSPENAAYTLCVNFLRDKKISHRPHVKRVMSEYENYTYLSQLEDFAVPENEFDIIGAAYQCLLLEGRKNSMGSYYTPEKLAAEMTAEYSASEGKRFFDPCCGSGAFLLAAGAKDPNLLFGAELDPTAAMIAKVNLLCRYDKWEFIPNIICGDYLGGEVFSDQRFDYIATNPPWGAASDSGYISSSISSGETFSCFFEKAFSQLDEGGKIRFLFPEAVLNVRAHRDIRKFILHNCRLERITIHDGSFSGVVTGFADILAAKAPPSDSLVYSSPQGESKLCVSVFRETKNLNFRLLSDADMNIIRKVREKGKFDLSSGKWALGIVTGDNKGKVFSERREGMEPVFTGRDILPYRLNPPENYIRYDRSSFQQTAKDEYYHAPEKLVYRFISRSPVFAYDDSGSLFLNSANILIPHITGMSVKTVMAFLNSPLYGFLYLKLFGEIKILRGNLSELPFPKISPEEDSAICGLADRIIRGEDAFEEINRRIYSIFGLNADEIRYFESVYYSGGKI